MIIYLTGIDGSGKSTITNILASEVLTGNVDTIWARYTPKLVKILIAPFKKKYVKDVKRDYLMNIKEYNRWSSYKKRITKSNLLSKGLYTLQSLDYSLQLFKIRKYLKRSDTRTVIIDRYLLDFIVDQSVNYGDISDNPITRFYLKKLEEFDYIFFIDTEEEIAFSRKDDIPSLDFLKQRRKYYKQYISKLKNGHIVSNNTDITQTINNIKLVLSSKKNQNESSSYWN